MNINSDINILGSLSELNLIAVILDDKIKLRGNNEEQLTSNIKTNKSYKRFVSAIQNTLLKFTDQNMEDLVQRVFINEGLSPNCLLLLFWNASVNNELLDYLNQNVFFPALYSGRISLKGEEVVACLKDLKQKEPAMQKWSDSTIATTASKYLTFLKKFSLMEGRTKKIITTPNMGDKRIVLFVYFLLSIETKSNLLESKWLQYCFHEKAIFIQQIMQKKLMKYYDLQYSANNLKMKPSFSYKELYDELY